MSEAVRVGSRVWRFNINRRVYRDGGGGGPIYAEHYEPYWIVGEEGRSWLLSSEAGLTRFTQKVSKQKVATEYSTDAEMADDVFIEGYRVRVSQDILYGRVTSDQLRRIVAILDEQRTENAPQPDSNYTIVKETNKPE